MPMSDEALRVEVVQASRLLYERGLISGFDGNTSVRTGRGTLLLTPAGVHKGLLQPKDLVEVDEASGAPLHGQTPTSEGPMHLAVLRARPDVTCVVHSHAPYAVAISLLEELSINGVLPELALALGVVKTLPYSRPGTDLLAAAVAGALLGANAVILERHGTVAVGNSVGEALARTEMIEHTARVLLIASSIRAPRALPVEELAVLLRRTHEAV